MASFIAIRSIYCVAVITASNHIPVVRCVKQTFRRQCVKHVDAFIAIELAGQGKGSMLKRYILSISHCFEPYTIAFAAGTRVCDNGEAGRY